MTQIIRSSILDSDCYGLVNPINCVGVMGAGLAKQFRDKYPEMFKAYSMACGEDKVKVGAVWPWSNYSLYPKPESIKIIIGFPTKNHWRHPSRIEYIETGLLSLRKYLQRTEMDSVAVPALGCGLGGLDWNVVESKIAYYLGDLEIRVDVYPPNGERYTL